WLLGGLCILRECSRYSENAVPDCSADKVCEYMFFFFRKSIGFFAEPDTFDQERYIFSARPHGLHTFQILADLLRRISVHHVPVLAGCHGHSGDGKVFVQLIERSSVSASAAAYNGSAHFHGLLRRTAVKQAVDKGNQRSVGGSKIDR